MLQHIRRSLGRKWLLAVGLPSLLLAVGAGAWLGTAVAATAVGLFVAATLLINALTMRWLVQQPLERLASAVRRAREGDFLHRLPVESEDELGRLADDLNRTLAAITDLHVRRIEDAASMESMQRELRLKAELEARVDELVLLYDLARRLSARLDLDGLLEDVVELVGRKMGDHAFALLLAEEGTGDLVVRGLSGLDPGALGSRLRAGEGPAGWAARERATVIVSDTRFDPRRPVLPWQNGAEGAILAVPMLHQEICAGVLAFFRPAPDAFAPAEVRLLESVAGQVAVAIENAQLHQQMVRLSQTDALTGVHNRRSFFARLELEADRCERFDHAMAVALVDVDRFRELNEAAGHATGDEILKTVARKLGATVRKVDLVARYGGEEFAVILPRADRAAALAAGEKLRAAIADAALPHPASERGRVTVSIGVATWPEDARELGTLIDCADAALYAAKRAGRDAVCAHGPGMREHPGRRRDQRTTADAEAGQAG